MAVKIRLRRVGAKKRPFYRLVVADSRSPRDGRFIELVGTYDPLANPAAVTLNADRIKEWMSKGARPTDIARQLLVSEGLLERTAAVYPKAEAKPKLNKKAQARAAADAKAAEAPAPVAEPEAEAAPAEEPAAEDAPAEEDAAPEAEAAPAEEEASPAEAEATEPAEAVADEANAEGEAPESSEEPKK